MCKSPGGGGAGVARFFLKPPRIVEDFFRTPLHPPSFSHLPGQDPLGDRHH